MCGLVGYLQFGETWSEQKGMAALKRMTDAIVFRGPDAEGQKVIGRCGMGHRRLSIVDLDARSSQPLCTIDQSLWIVFNGEVYNYQDIRKELEALGHRFKTESDTEVILESYREWGVDCLQRFRGMFAFAIWDPSNDRMFIARDRFGKKPLFYYRDNEVMLFASEIKSMIRYPGFVRNANLRSIYDYLSFGYCVGSETAFQGVHRLPPAHYMVIEGDGSTRVERYWSLAEIDPSKEKASRDELAEELVHRFDEAIRYRLIADVPVGAFLSGGVDSSAVVARMAPLSSKTLKTFSVGFDIDGFDETAYAREVAQRYGTEHHSFMMDYDIIEELPKIIWHYGEPYADSSAIVTYALSREVRKHVTVGVTGDGGDEVLLGYSRYVKLNEAIKAIESGGSHAYLDFKVGLEQMAPQIRDLYARSMFKFRNEHMLWGAGDAMMPYLTSLPSDSLGQLLEMANPDRTLDLAARTDCQVYLPDDLLVKADIATMAHSLEGRSPFLDHTLADWAASIPQNQRVFERHGELQTKGLLKYAMEPYLPHGCMYRRKMGFSVPVAHWMKFELRDFLQDTLMSDRFLNRGFVTKDFIEFMLQRHWSDYEDHGTRLWTLLCLEMWCQTYLDNDGYQPMSVDVTRGYKSQKAMVA